MRVWGRLITAIGNCVAAALLLAGCQTLKGGPERLYTVEEEVAAARAWLTTSVDYYYQGHQTIALRNEIIARRMYVIDVEYSQYEQALTRERQEVGLLTSTVSQGLNVAGALFTPASTVKILSGLAGGVGAVRGYYDSEVVIAKTIQIAQAHMHALRDDVAGKIKQAMSQDVDRYPLAVAMSDLEDYYRAGTLAAGLIDALGMAGDQAKGAAQDKPSTIQITYAADPDTQTPLEQYINAGGPSAVARLNLILHNPPINSPRNILALLYDGTPGAKALRAQLIKIARGTLPDFPKPK